MKQNHAGENYIIKIALNSIFLFIFVKIVALNTNQPRDNNKTSNITHKYSTVLSGGSMFMTLKNSCLAL